MRPLYAIALTCMILLGLVGCQGKDDPATPADNKTPPENDAPTTPEAELFPNAREVAGEALLSDPAAQATSRFLEGWRLGDNRIIQAALTPTARSQMGENISDAGLLAVGGVYSVTKVRYVDDSSAQVVATVSEQDPTTGEVISEELMVGLRLVEEGWRVAVLALEPLVEGQNWIRLNLEDPEDAVRELAAAEEQAMRYYEEQAANAGQPGTSPPPGATP